MKYFNKQIYYWAHMLDEAFNKDNLLDEDDNQEAIAANKEVANILKNVQHIDKDTIPKELKEKITKVDIPDSVTSIGSYAFSGCQILTSVTIPDSVTNIGNFAFSDCISLTSVTIGNGVTSIGQYAFYNCTNLTSVTIPNSVTNIGNYAFTGCSGLTSVTIPASVTSIGEGMFTNCSGLTSVTIPNSVTSIRNNTFYNCKNIHLIFDKKIEEVKAMKYYPWKIKNPNKHIFSTDKKILAKIDKSKQIKGEILLAPNGKPSNLNKRQWYQVRTPQFKEWFGDWENDPEHSSKMLDENGEPAVFFHGSSAWNPFANDEKIAKDILSMKQETSKIDNLYNEDETSPVIANVLDKLIGDMKKRAEVYVKQVRQFKDDTIFMFDRKDKNNAKEYAKWSSHGSRVKSYGVFKSKDFGGSILQLFVNMRKPLIIDFHERSYSDYDKSSNEDIKHIFDDIKTFINLTVSTEKLNQINLDHINGFGRVLKYIHDIGDDLSQLKIKNPEIDKLRNDVDNMSKKIEQLKDILNEDDEVKDEVEEEIDDLSSKLKQLILDHKNAFNKLVELTNESQTKLANVVNYLKNYDGLICKNVSDMGENKIQTQYVCFSPYNVKSATKNNGNFSKDDAAIMNESK